MLHRNECVSLEKEGSFNREFRRCDEKKGYINDRLHCKLARARISRSFHLMMMESKEFITDTIRSVVTKPDEAKCA